MLPRQYEGDLYLQDIREMLGLSDTLARTVALRYFDRLSWAEIADIEGVRPETIHSRLRRARLASEAKGLPIPRRIPRLKWTTWKKFWGPHMGSTFNAADHPG